MLTNRRGPYCACRNRHSTIELLSQQWDAIVWACVLCDYTIPNEYASNFALKLNIHQQKLFEQLRRLLKRIPWAKPRSNFDTDFSNMTDNSFNLFWKDFDKQNTQKCWLHAGYNQRKLMADNVTIRWWLQDSIESPESTQPFWIS